MCFVCSSLSAAGFSNKQGLEQETMLKKKKKKIIKIQNKGRKNNNNNVSITEIIQLQVKKKIGE